MSGGTLRDRLRTQLADCKMPGALEAVDDILRRIDAGELSAGPAMEALLGSHIALRNQRRLQTAMRSRRYLEGVIAKALGGRAAELIFLGADSVTSGAGSDLIQATSVARRMVGELGMSERVGLVSADPAANGGGAPSAQLQSRIDDAVADLVKVQADRAEALVREHRGAVEAIASALLEHEVLDAEEVIAIATRHGALGDRERVAA